MIEWDMRIGGIPLHYVPTVGRCLVQIPDEIRTCVAFLACKQDDRICLMGTVFFVGVPFFDVPGSQKRIYGYAVTAKHVIEEIKKRTDDGKVYFRLNFRNSQNDLVLGDINSWYFHPDDPLVDVAVMPWENAPPGTAHTTCSVESFVTEDIIREHSIGVGEEVFLSGLFSRHTGTKKNIPILRVGNIAAMPEEPVNTGLGLTEAYLIEVRSIGGLSGSPVFVHLGIARHKQGQLQPATDLWRPIYLLGLMHGHWDSQLPDIDDTDTDKMYTKLNMGIAIVVPAQRIAETINQPKLLQMRYETIKNLKQELAPTFDTK